MLTSFTLSILPLRFVLDNEALDLRIVHEFTLTYDILHS